MEELINLIQKEMISYYGIDLTRDQVVKYVIDNNLEVFDTLEREDFADYIAVKLTGMHWPLNMDSEEYKKEFYKKLSAS